MRFRPIFSCVEIIQPEKPAPAPSRYPHKQTPCAKRPESISAQIVKKV
jgi:hypothetical protein